MIANHIVYVCDE